MYLNKQLKVYTFFHYCMYMIENFFTNFVFYESSYTLACTQSNLYFKLSSLYQNKMQINFFPIPQIHRHALPFTESLSVYGRKKRMSEGEYMALCFGRFIFCNKYKLL